MGRYVYVPEEWSRQARAADIRSTIARIVAGVFFGGLLLSAAVFGVILWSRRQYAPMVSLLGAALMLAASIVNAGNGWPAVIASLSTAQPLPLQLGAVAGVGLVGLALVSVLVGLALGAVPRRLADTVRLPERSAIAMGVSAGIVAAAVSAASAWLRTPAWAHSPEITPLNTMIPLLEIAIDPIPGFLTRLAVLLSLFVAVDRLDDRVDAPAHSGRRRPRARGDRGVRGAGRRRRPRVADGRGDHRRGARDRVRRAAPRRPVDDPAHPGDGRRARRRGPRCVRVRSRAPCRPRSWRQS